MRTALVALVGLLLALPAVAAQSTTPTTVATTVLTDPAADVQAQAGPQLTAAPGNWDAIDLLALNVSEDPDAFHFQVQVANLGTDQPRSDAGNTQVWFSYDNATFIVNLARSIDNAAYFGSLYMQDDAQSQFHFVHPLPASRDLTHGWLWTALDRTDIVGASGQTPGRGQTLQDLHVISSADVGFLAAPGNLGVGGYPTWVGDVMPEDGQPGATWTVLFRGHDGSGADLTSAEPFRASNGEATTYEYRVTAKQDGSDTARFHLFAEKVPPEWNITLPGSMLDLPAGKPVEFPVYVTTPFRHIHGASEAFTLHLHQDGGDRWATVEIGVHYTAIPQPAGHHPQLYFHTRTWSQQSAVINPPLGGSTGEVTMDALEEDPADTGHPVEGWSNFGDPQTATWHWSICLDPQLHIGLDFNLSKVGTLEFPVTTTRPLSGAVVAGRLLYLEPGEPISQCFSSDYADRKSTVVAEVTGTPQDLAANAAAKLVATVTPKADGDFIPYQAGAALVLELTVSGAAPAVGGVGGVSLTPGGSVTLPLDEYHDAVAVVSHDGAAPAAPGFVAEPSVKKKSPGVEPALVAVGLLALALMGRRRA